MLKVVYSPEYEAKKEVELPKELREAAYMIGGGGDGPLNKDFSGERQSGRIENG